jgi:hypothetical protein
MGRECLKRKTPGERSSAGRFGMSEADEDYFVAASYISST